MPKNLQKYFKFTVLLFIGCIGIHLRAWGNSGPEFSEPKPEEKVNYSELKGPPNGQGGWVIVEPLNILSSRDSGEIRLVPYKYRREKWGQAFSLGYSLFAPTNMESNTGAFYFEDIYDTKADVPLVEFQWNLKRNFSLGSLALEVGVGYYSNDSDTDLVDSKLEIIPLRVGLNYTMDMLFDRPYIAPYVAVGGYVFKYTETQGTTSYNGTTQVAPYFVAGLQFAIDWLDNFSANIAYIESGLEATYLFVEGRMFAASTAEADPNFETDFQGSAGLRLEF
ncbi:MAG: hypothetical protein KDD22_00500 [Bdellovibrionales bacterium]|nr:hypothetical protein [Bdellovibrionales bacterium]